MATRPFADEWLVPTVTALLGPELVERLRAGAQPPASLWDLAVAGRHATDDQVLTALSARHRVGIADLTRPEPAAREIVPEALARRYRILPVRATDSIVEVATANPTDVDLEKAIAFATGREVRMTLAAPSRIAQMTEELYRPDAVLNYLIEGMGRSVDIRQIEQEVPSDEAPVSAEEASQRPVVRLLDLVLSDGILSRASDIHVEPEEGGFAVRYRIDGVLRQVMKVPRAAGFRLVSRIKILSSLDIADRLRPQDGRARVAVDGAPVDLRVSTLPASLGEKVVIRILDARATVLSLDALGLAAGELEAVRALLAHHEGVVLVTGPTGSGKTTTLYSAIRSIQSGQTNIVTVEDPVEYRLQGIVQVQVHEKAGLTFAGALRSILRQDPDVVLVGEVRDKETAQIAVQASLTGHLVLSTLHTNDAANAVTRLVDIGIEPYKIAAALRGVIAQRLMRRLCPACRDVRTEPLPARLAAWVPAVAPLRRAVGCPECAMTGYRGRFPIVEVLSITPDVERAIGAGAAADRIAEAGRAGGMRGLWESGLAHVLDGETSLEELLRVVDVPAGAPRAGAESPPAIAPPPPAAPVAGDPLGLLEDFAPSATARAGRKVLLVDDEDALRGVLRDLLEREGYSVSEARDGIQALDQVDRVGPDMIVLDLALPGIDGYGVLSHLRSRPSTSAIPVVVLTARGDEDAEVRVFRSGANDFLCKPFRPRALAARLDAALGRSLPMAP